MQDGGDRRAAVLPDTTFLPVALDAPCRVVGHMHLAPSALYEPPSPFVVEWERREELLCQPLRLRELLLVGLQTWKFDLAKSFAVPLKTLVSL